MRDLGLFVAKKRGSGVDDAWEEKKERERGCDDVGCDIIYLP